MRHEKLMKREGVDALDIAAVWPASSQVAPVPVPELAAPIESAQPTPAAPDVPAAVGGMIAASYAAVIGALYFATAGTAHSIYMIAISAMFVAIFFAVPRTFFKVEPMSRSRVRMEEFMRSGIDTATGRASAKAALVQMMVVPVFLVLGITAMGIAASVIM